MHIPLPRRTRTQLPCSTSRLTTLRFILATHILVSLVPRRAFANVDQAPEPVTESALAGPEACSANLSDFQSAHTCNFNLSGMAGQRVASFTWQLQQHLAKKPADTNSAGTFVSPVSLYIALGLAMSGAGPASTTQQELYHILHQDKNRLMGLLPPKAADAAAVDQLTQELSALSSSLEQQQTGSELILANGVWVNKQDKIEIRPEYAASMLQLFKAEVREADSVDTINEWAERVTKGLIKVAVPPGTPFDLVLTNAVYFKGMWEHAFKKESASKQPFKLQSGSEVQVDMMTKRFKSNDGGPNARKVQYIQASKYQAVRLPYKGSTISAVVVLPSDDLSQQDVAAAVATLDIHELLDASKYKNIGSAGLDIHLPKFTVKSAPFSLKKELQALGVEAPFTDNVADFGKLSDEPTYISDILQSVCVIVDEEGTEAAAVTAVIMMRATAVMAPPPLIRFDRPFLFMIVDDATSTPLFVGTVTDPSRAPA